MANAKILEIPAFVHIASWRSVIDRRKTIPVEFSYPLKESHVKEFSKDGGWALPDIIDIVCRHYQEIYEEETVSASVSGSPIRPLINRRTTDGKYGIWGHDISDLGIDGITRGKDGVWRIAVSS